MNANINSLEIRLLTPDDMDGYRQARARITEVGDDKNFSSSFIREAGFTTEQHYRDWLALSQEHCTIGTFINDKLVGLIGVLMYGKPENRTFEYETVWIEPEYRKQGFVKAAYLEAQSWAEDHGYSHVVHLIRADNKRALEIRIKQGGIFSHMISNVKWSDGSIADQCCYTTDLFIANEPRLRSEQSNTPSLKAG